MSLIRFVHICSWMTRAASNCLAVVRRHILLGIFFAFTAGIVVNERFRPGLWWEVGAAAGSLCCLGLAARGGQRRFLPVLLAAFCFLGMLYCRARAYLPQNDIVRMSYREDLTGSRWAGRVIGDVKQSRAFGGVQQFEFLLSHRMDQYGKPQDTGGRILVKLFGRDPVREGDRLALEGTLHRPFEFSSRGRFSYCDYLKRRGIFRVLSVGRAGSVVSLGSAQGPWGRWRNRMKQIFDEALGEAESAIIKAVVLGDRSGIRQDVREVFARTGTAHILAISGLHMSIVLMIVLTIAGFLPCSLKIKYLLSLVVLAAYLPMTGMRVSVIRSAVMSIVMLYAVITERRVCSLNSVGLAGLLILLMRPQDCLMIDFQLSFSAVLAIVVFFPATVSCFSKWCPWCPVVLCQWMAVSLCAWTGTAGWIMYYFGRLTPGAVLANMCLVWLVPGVIALGFLVLLTGLAGMPVMPGLLSGALTVLLRLMIWMNVVFGRLPLMCLDDVHLSGRGCLGYYGVLSVMACWVLAARQKESPLMPGGFPKTV